MGLQVYEPSPESLPRLDELTEYVEDARPIGDERPTTATDGRAPRPHPRAGCARAASSTSSASAARACSRSGRSTASTLAGSTASCEPSELVFSDFESDSHLHAKWVGLAREPAPLRVRRSPRTRPSSSSSSRSTSSSSSASSTTRSTTCRSLGMLNRVTQAGRDDALRDDRSTRVPTRSCACAGPRTGRRRASRRSRRSGSSSRGRAGGRSRASPTTGRASTEALFLCEKTDELRGRRRSLGRRDPHRPAVASGGCPTCSLVPKAELDRIRRRRPLRGRSAHAPRRRLPAERARRGEARRLRSSRLDVQRHGRRRVPPVRGAEHGGRRAGTHPIATCTSRRRDTTCRVSTRRCTRSV